MSQLASELKQNKPFTSTVQEAVLSIKRTAALLDLRVAELLRPYGVTPTQYNVLRILRGAGADGLPRCEVQGRLVAPVADTTRLLDRLEKMGLVSRARNTEDRRVVTSKITPRGLALLDKVAAPLRQFEEHEVGQVSDARLRSLIGILDEVRRLTPCHRG
ncbi:MAG TPA: MarR family transcriptional regulator [Gemmatimonadales bacterium]|nr:MarR family transcriptional regulator [Gemmatimonadales bacterium]HRZ08417.1 MarR family transcriptional regulator [Gemmatimonadales bacterium]